MKRLEKIDQSDFSHKNYGRVDAIIGELKKEAEAAKIVLWTAEEALGLNTDPDKYDEIKDEIAEAKKVYDLKMVEYEKAKNFRDAMKSKEDEIFRDDLRQKHNEAEARVREIEAEIESLLDRAFSLSKERIQAIKRFNKLNGRAKKYGVVLYRRVIPVNRPAVFVQDILRKLR